MLEKQWQKQAVAIRRDRRTHERDGWEYLGEGGGRIWELVRGSRMGHRIVAAEVAADGLGVWVKVEDPRTTHPQ